MVLDPKKITKLTRNLSQNSNMRVCFGLRCESIFLDSSRFFSNVFDFSRMWSILRFRPPCFFLESSFDCRGELLCGHPIPLSDFGEDSCDYKDSYDLVWIFVIPVIQVIWRVLLSVGTDFFDLVWIFVVFVIRRGFLLFGVDSSNLHDIGATPSHNHNVFT